MPSISEAAVLAAAGHNPDCIGCGVANPASAGFLVLSWSSTELRGTVSFSNAHVGFPDRAHGGAIAIALDEALGRLADLHFDEPAVTAQLDVSFQSPAPLGVTLEVRAGIQAQQGRKLWVIGEITCPRKVASARGLFLRERRD